MTNRHLFNIETGERLYLNADEREAFLQATKLEDTDVKFFCQTIYYTGGRLREVLGLTYNRFDYQECGVIFETSKQRKKGVYRFVDLPEEYLEVLNDVYQIRKAQTIEKKKEELVWKFTGRTGENYVKRVMLAAGITGKRATPRGLRHAFGVAAVENKIPAHQLQEWLGHRYADSTVVYTKVQGKERRRLAERLWKKK